MKWAAAVVALLTLMVFVWVALSRGIRVEIENVSGSALTNVRVEVKRVVYDVGDLGVGETDSVKIEPAAETDEVRVRWVGPDGKDHFGRVAVAIDPAGMHGTIAIQLGDETIQGNKFELDYGFF